MKAKITPETAPHKSVDTNHIVLFKDVDMAFRFVIDNWEQFKDMMPDNIIRKKQTDPKMFYCTAKMKIDILDYVGIESIEAYVPPAAKIKLTQENVGIISGSFD